MENLHHLWFSEFRMKGCNRSLHLECLFPQNWLIPPEVDASDCKSRQAYWTTSILDLTACKLSIIPRILYETQSSSPFPTDTDVYFTSHSDNHEIKIPNSNDYQILNMSICVKFQFLCIFKLLYCFIQTSFLILSISHIHSCFKRLMSYIHFPAAL